MDKEEYENFCDAIKHLTNEQKQEVSLKLKDVNSDIPNNLYYEDWLLDGVITVLNERGLGHTVPHNFFIKNSKSFHAFRTGSIDVRRCLEQSIPNLNHTEKRVLGLLCAMLLVDLIDSWKYPVSLDAMLFNIRRVPEAVERGFPGYVSAGLLHCIIRRDAEFRRASI